MGVAVLSPRVLCALFSLRRILCYFVLFFASKLSKKINLLYWPASRGGKSSHLREVYLRHIVGEISSFCVSCEHVVWYDVIAGVAYASCCVFWWTFLYV